MQVFCGLDLLFAWEQGVINASYRLWQWVDVHFGHILLISEEKQKVDETIKTVFVSRN